MTDPQLSSERPRRAVLATGGAGLAGLALTACGSSDPTSPTSSSSSSSSQDSSSSADSSSSTDSSSSAAAGGSGIAVKTAAVPVGGGTILGKDQIVVTQPSAGSYQAFSAVCPHEGCLVSEIQDQKILCLCHGSEFSIADGSVVQGPANQPLEAKTVTANGDTLTVN